jgi:hypothetical protein
MSSNNLKDLKPIIDIKKKKNNQDTILFETKKKKGKFKRFFKKIVAYYNIYLFIYLQNNLKA